MTTGNTKVVTLNFDFLRLLSVTKQCPKDFKMCTNRMSQNNSDVARLASSLFTPSTNDSCIHFYYHIHVNGTLRVYFQYDRSPKSLVTSIQGEILFLVNVIKPQ